LQSEGEGVGTAGVEGREGFGERGGVAEGFCLEGAQARDVEVAGLDLSDVL